MNLEKLKDPWHLINEIKLIEEAVKENNKKTSGENKEGIQND